MPVLSDRVGTFTDSVIRRMTRINNQYDSINLSQGFPDFDPPKQLLDALAETAYKGPHQYAVTFGAQNFREALAKKTSPALHLSLIHIYFSSLTIFLNSRPRTSKLGYRSNDALAGDRMMMSPGFAQALSLIHIYP